MGTWGFELENDNLKENDTVVVPENCSPQDLLLNGIVNKDLKLVQHSVELGANLKALVNKEKMSGFLVQHFDPDVCNFAQKKGVSFKDSARLFEIIFTNDDVKAFEWFTSQSFIKKRIEDGSWLDVLPGVMSWGAEKIFTKLLKENFADVAPNLVAKTGISRSQIQKLSDFLGTTNIPNVVQKGSVSLYHWRQFVLSSCKRNNTQIMSALHVLNPNLFNDTLAEFLSDDTTMSELLGMKNFIESFPVNQQKDFIKSLTNLENKRFYFQYGANNNLDLNAPVRLSSCIVAKVQPQNVFEQVLFKNAPVALDLIKKSRKEDLEAVLQNKPEWLALLLPSLRREALTEYLKRTDHWKSWTDSWGNNLLHYVVNFNKLTKALAEDVLSIDSELFLQANDRGQTPLSAFDPTITSGISKKLIKGALREEGIKGAAPIKKRKM